MVVVDLCVVVVAIVLCLDDLAIVDDLALVLLDLCCGSWMALHYGVALRLLMRVCIGLVFFRLYIFFLMCRFFAHVPYWHPAYLLTY